MTFIDLNADIGEADSLEGQKSEAHILKYISSANIACGGHAGNDDTMRRTAKLAREHGVSIGAHPGYADPANFGRRSMALNDPASRKMVLKSLIEQIVRLSENAAKVGASVGYVKPHGALYNDAVKSAVHADLIANAICAVDPALMFLGGPNSEMGKAAANYGLSFVAEGFIDRRYTDDGHLQSRAIDGAVISDQSARLAQLESLVRMHSAETASGQRVDIDAQSLCLHGDSQGAVETARQAREKIESLGIKIKAFCHV